jgi:hypothetical protein
MKILSDYKYIITRVAGPCLTILALWAIIKIYGVDDYARTSILATVGTMIYSFTLNQYLKSLPRAFFIRSYRRTLVKQYILVSPILGIFFFFLLCIFYTRNESILIATTAISAGIREIGIFTYRYMKKNIILYSQYFSMPILLAINYMIYNHTNNFLKIEIFLISVNILTFFISTYLLIKTFRFSNDAPHIKTLIYSLKYYFYSLDGFFNQLIEYLVKISINSIAITVLDICLKIAGFSFNFLTAYYHNLIVKKTQKNGQQKNYYAMLVGVAISFILIIFTPSEFQQILLIVIYAFLFKLFNLFFYYNEIITGKKIDYYRSLILGLIFLPLYFTKNKYIFTLAIVSSLLTNLYFLKKASQNEKK